MNNAEEFVSQIKSRFEFLKEAVSCPRAKRLAIVLPNQECVGEVLDFVTGPCGFAVLLAITGLDETERYGVIYHLFSETLGILNLKIPVDKQRPVIQTVSKRFEQADVYERELVDLLGIEVQGLVPGNRYPLPDNWPSGQFPLRKDWKAQGGDVCATEGCDEQK